MNNSLLCSIALCLLMFYTTSLTAVSGTIKIYPFEISDEKVDFERVDVGKSRTRKLKFTNTLNESVILEKFTLLEDFIITIGQQSIKYPIKFDSKGIKEFEFTYSPKEPDTIATKLTFVYSTAQKPSQTAELTIPFTAMAMGVRLEQKELDFGEVFIGDTIIKNLIIFNRGNKEAEYKILGINVTNPTSFQCLAKVGDIISIPPSSTVIIPFRFTPQKPEKMFTKCSITISDNAGLGYEALSTIVVYGSGKNRAVLSHLSMNSGFSVEIGDTLELPLHYTFVNTSALNEIITLSGTAEFRDGIVGIVPDNSAETTKIEHTAINGRRVITWQMTVPYSSGELNTVLPFRIVGTLGVADTTDMKIRILECSIDNSPVRLDIRDIDANITVTGYLEYNNRKRTVLAQGLGNIQIKMSDAIVRNECIMQFEGLNQPATLQIFDASGAIIGSFIVPQFQSPTISIPHKYFSFGSYTAVLWYGNEYSTTKFIVLP
ncbi:MAG TPA: hypothetical protein PLI74_11180 [Candidatus Kapabacteria bacterium]|nr:hypothetical protein [Ignavibacteria bacterium]HRK60196.1 hypothetical protein [Candidatus Kapabacteria bacterium]